MRATLVGLLLLGAPAVLSAQSVAIVDVTVIPMDRETTLPRQTVVVRGERILSVGPTANTPVPDDAVIVDGAGRYLVPGLTDAHVHLAGTVFGPGRAQFGDALLYLAYGVTTVVNLGGTPEHLDWRRRIIAGELLAPTIYTSPPFFNEPRVNSPEEVEREISATVAAGYDLLKFREIVGRNPAPTTAGLSLTAYRRMNEAARRAGLPLVGHASVNLSLDAMLDARQQSLAHVGELTRLYFNPVMRHRWSLVAGGIGLLIALVVSLTSGLLAVIRRNRRAPRPHTRVQRSTAVLAASGVVAAACYGGFSPGGPLFDSNGLRVIFTADALGLPLITPGSSLHRELALLHEARLTRYEALHAATVAPASFLGKTEEFGTIQVGRRADLLLVEGNPLQDLSSLRQPLAVMVRGRWLPREQLDAMLAALRY